MATPPLLSLSLLRLAALPWYLGGTLGDDALEVLTHTTTQVALLLYHTAGWVYYPIFWVQVAIAATWFADEYGFPDIPIPYPPSLKFSLRMLDPQIGIAGRTFDVHTLPTSLNLRCAEPLATLVRASGFPNKFPGPPTLQFQPSSPPFSSFSFPQVPGQPRTATLLEFSFSLDWSLALAAPLTWWSLAEIKLGLHLRSDDVSTNLPEYIERWRAAHKLTKFFTEMFTGGHLPIGSG
jgi:hypothetical protein